MAAVAEALTLTRTAELAEAMTRDQVTLPIQINGKRRGEITVPADMAIVGDDTRQKTLTYHLMREVSLSIPRDPQLMDGAF